MKKQTKKIALWIAVIIALLLLIALSFNFISFNKKQTNANSDYSNLPQECQKPDSQDLQSWKEHLGHHENTKFCLEYYK